ncbi:MAG: ComEA family DNA-binding protein [Propionibacteriaceae bacterium]|nr:ComEA family DNA-binding protein [Propionibacteriaceae bacterium]
MTRRRHDDVLTDYVRERLDRLVEEAGPAPDSPESLRTVLRPRPLLGGVPKDWTPLPGEKPGPPTSVDEDQGRVGEGGPGLGASPTRWVHRFTRQHLLVCGVVLAVGVLIAAFALTRARSVPIESPVPVSAPAIAESAEPSHGPASPTPTTEPLRIHVVGQVRQPGVHALAVGARVADAIEAAGGLTDAAKPGELNLAQPLADGQQVIIGGPGRASEVRGGDAGEASQGGSGGVTGSAGVGKVNLNSASASQLDTLPGVGPVTAEKIVAWRTQHGKFTNVAELQEVPGIGPKTYAEIAPHVTV